MPKHCPYCGHVIPGKLSKREQEVAVLVAVGLLNKEIASELGGISDQTVKNHVSAIMEKFGIKSRHSILLELLERKLVSLEEIEEVRRGTKKFWAVEPDKKGVKSQ